MSRYSKISSKYILSKFHQNTTQGAIYERDWTTIGGVHRLEPGKRVYYGSSNFLFTDSTIPVYKKVRKNGKWVGTFVYDEVRNAEDIVNLIKVNTDSENLSDYAYWGSMTELFRGSVEHIIRTFPGRLRSTKKKFNIHHHWVNENNGVEYWTEAPGYVLGNPFGLDMHTAQVEEINIENILHYISLCWKKYVFEDYENGEERKITSYSILNDVYTQYDCEGRYFLLCSIVIYCEEYSFVVDTYLADGKIVYCYRPNENPSPQLFYITYFREETSRSTFQDNNSNSDFTYTEDFSIHPNKEIIEDYFDSLDGFEWKLLNLRTKPYYRNTFLYPVQLENGNWRLVRRTYTWPSEGIWIDVESTDFNSFINGMIEICEIYDNLWCDALWRCMVHESVKNFDWSYRREYDENDEQDNIDGGNRMKDVMRLYGIIYDKSKRLVDGIAMSNNITYDGYNNCPNAQLSDRNVLQGWDIFSTQHPFFWYEIENEMSLDEIYTPLPTLPVKVDDESPDYISVTCPGQPETLYYKKQALSLTGLTLDEEFYTQEQPIASIVMKQSNPWVSNNVYGRMYAEVGFSSIPTGYDFTLENRTLNEYPYQLFEGYTYPPYVRVVSNKSTKYYKLLSSASDFESNNEAFFNKTWFESVNENSVSTSSTDILFNRCLNLSSNRILKTKGAKEAIDMAFSLFGFGRYDAEENPYGDYSIEEHYFSFTPKELQNIFYFYEVIDENEAEEHNPISVDEIPEASSESYEYIVITTTIDETSEFKTYYRLNGDYTVAETIKLLYAHRLTERIYDDYYSGVPIRESFVGNTRVIIPFFDKTKQYEGNLYFEGNGGWMKHGDKSWDYSETIPYLHILQKISDLFTVNANETNNDDIYYVADVSDYYEYTDDIPYYLSNFFKIKDKYNLSTFSSWVNVPVEGPIQNGGYSGINGVTYEDYKHAKHLNDIIPSILYNNPHTGYGKYDMGSEFISYMNHPYKYSAVNYLYDDDYYQNMASQFTFPYKTNINEKIISTAETISYDGHNETEIDVNAGYTQVNDKYLKITLFENGAPIDATNPHYRMHLEYIRNVVLKYVAQVIPSTTLLVLSNFETPEIISTETVHISVSVVGEGTVYGEGDYLKTTMVTLNAVPSEGYHFKGWKFVGDDAIITTNNLYSVMVCDNIEDCEITVGCTSGECGQPT